MAKFFSFVFPRTRSRPAKLDRLSLGLAIMLCATLGLSTGHAAYPLVVDDAGVHPPGESEWVASADALRTPATEALDADFSLTVGLIPRLEGAVGFGYGWTRQRAPADAPWHDGVLDLTLGLKSPLLQGDAVPFNLTVSAAIKVPTASPHLGLGTGFTDFSLLAIATHTWGSLSLDLNAGYTWTAVGTRAAHAGDGWFAGAALRWQARERLLLFAETYANLPTDSLGEPNGTVRAGGQFALRPGVLLSAALGTGYGPGATELTGTFGLTLIF
jgi:hypothetical protein